MRNLKRVLSLALAAIMLIGMMAFGTSAANVTGFKDADQINDNNLEAATVVAGLKIFEGADGNFMPAGPVDRLTMATLIVKLLNGPDFNADVYRGLNIFNDVPTGSWYEGYVNMCAGLGYLNGYGNGKYGPTDTITTYQASLLLQRALGYWDTKDPTPINEVTVTARAGEIGLYGNLNLKVNDKLTREDVAVMIFNALTAQRASWNENRQNYVKANNDAVAVVPGVTDPYNTLLYQVYNTYVVRGVVTANGMTDALLYSDDDTPGDTTVVFDELTDLNQDGRPEASTYNFNYDTGLDMIGHNADIYYQLNRGTPIVKAIVDKATLVKEIPYDSNTTRLNQAASAAGFRNRTILGIDSDDYQVNYDLSANATVAKTNTPLWTDVNNSIGKTLLVISNSADYTVDCVILLDQELDQVKNINRRGVYSLEVWGGSAVNFVVDTDNAQVGDYVIATDIGNRGDRCVIETAEITSGRVDTIRGRVGAISEIVAGTSYRQSPVVPNDTPNPNSGNRDLPLVTRYQSIDTFTTLNLILDKDGKLIGYASDAAADPDYCYVAWYGSVHVNPLTSGSNVSGFTTEALAAYVVMANGTNGIYRVGDRSNGVLDDVDTSWNTSKAALDAAIDVLNLGEYTTNTYNATANSETGGLGIWKYTVSGDTITLTSLITTTSVDESNEMLAANTSTDIKFVKGHSSVLKYTYTGTDKGTVSTIANVTAATPATANEKDIWQTNKTVYFYVNGTMGSPANNIQQYADGSRFTVKAYNSVVDITPFTVALTAKPTKATIASKTQGYLYNTDTYVAQAFVEEQNVANGTQTMTAVLVRNVQVTETGDLYYYTKGTVDRPNYTVTNNGDGTYTTTYRVFTLDGDETTLVFNSGNVNNARDKETGFYEALSTDMRRYVALTTLSPYNTQYGASWTYMNDAAADALVEGAKEYAVKTSGERQYVVNATLGYREAGNVMNLIDNVNGRGVIFNLDRETKVKDTCGSPLGSLDDIVDTFERDGECQITISYVYDTTKWTVDTVFITSYSPSGTQAPGTTTPIGKDLTVTEVDRVLYVTSKDYLSNAQVANAIRDYLNDETISTVTFDAKTNKVTVVFRNGNITEQDVVVAQVANTAAVAGSSTLAAAQNKVNSTKKPTGTITIEGNKMTATGEDSTYNTPEADGTSPAAKDLVNFLVALHDNGAKQIKIGDVAFTWNNQMHYASKWVKPDATTTACTTPGHSGDLVLNGAATDSLMGAIADAMGGSVSAGESKTVTIVVDGAPIDITLAIPAASAGGGAGG